MSEMLVVALCWDPHLNIKRECITHGKKVSRLLVAETLFTFSRLSAVSGENISMCKTNRLEDYYLKEKCHKSYKSSWVSVKYA